MGDPVFVLSVTPNELQQMSLLCLHPGFKKSLEEQSKVGVLYAFWNVIVIVLAWLTLPYTEASR